MIDLKNIEMVYDDNGTKINALKIKKIIINDGEKVAFIGSSGCGKTTLFNLISGMITPTSGKVVVENVVLPMSFSKRYSKKEMEEEAINIIKRVGLEKKLNQKVKTLSGGEKQRVAIARSIVNKPNIILADEPTGNLDYKNGAKIMDLIMQIAKEEKATLLVITHNNSQLDMFDRTINVEELNEAIK